MPISEDRKGLKLNLGQYLDIAGNFLNIKLLKHIFLNKFFFFEKWDVKVFLFKLFYTSIFPFYGYTIYKML